MKEVLFRTAAEWRRWLARHHALEQGVWLVFTKPRSPVRSIDYASALDEALCYGWIDSIIRRIDDERYARKFTPRSPRSLWSAINRKRVAQLRRERRLTPAGLEAVRRSQQAGTWNAPRKPLPSFTMPAAFRAALRNHPRARKHFEGLSATERKRYILWISLAKRDETRLRRIRESITLLTKNQKLGLK